MNLFDSKANLSYAGIMYSSKKEPEQPVLQLELPVPELLPIEEKPTKPKKPIEIDLNEPDTSNEVNFEI